MTISEAEIVGLAAAWLWPFFRIAAAISVVPVFGNRVVPRRVKVGVAFVLTLAIAPALPPVPAVEPLSAASLLVTVQQVLIGLAMGFAVRLAFVVLEVAGQIIAILMGLGFAAMVDPQNGIDVPVVSQFYVVVATLVFLGLDGHLVIVEVLADSFTVLPVGGPAFDVGRLWLLTGQAGWIFASAVLIALPAVATLMTVNLAFGVMTRAAPQLNIFAVGFPITLIFGFLVIWLALKGFVENLDGVFAQAFDVARMIPAAAP